MTQNTAFVNAELKRIGDLKSKSAKLIRFRAKQSKLLSIQRRNDSKALGQFFVILVVTVLSYIIGNVFSVRQKHSYAFAWWEGQKLRGAVEGQGRNGEKAYGYKRGAQPLGRTHFSVFCCAISADYHPLMAVTGLLNICPTINRAGALFLLSFTQMFFNNIEGIHWSGSPEQLRYDKATTFIKSWADWNVKENVWAWLYPQELDFTNSLAVNEAQNSWDGSQLSSLFYGGLCHLAAAHTSDDSDADHMMQHLLGVKLVYFRKCEDDRKNKAVKNGIYGAAIAGSGYATANMAWAQIQKSLPPPPEPGPPGIELTDGGYGAWEAGEGAGMDVAEDAGAAAAEAAGEGVAGPASLLCGPFAPLCELLSAAAIAAAAAAMTLLPYLGPAAASAAVGVGVGAITYYKDKCKGGVYYILVDGKEVPWNGDISLLPPGTRHARSNDSPPVA